LVFGLVSAEACLVGLVLLGLGGIALVAWRDWRDKRVAGAVLAASASVRADFAATALKLDSEAAALLKLVRTHLDAGERYSVTLAQAGESLPKKANAEEIGIIVKFLLAENAKMQNEAHELKACLEQSRSQIETLRSHLTEAREICVRDPLTSLGNRRCFDDGLVKALTEARTRGTSLSLVLADIDNFKRVNDLFGHRVGDEILKMFARVLTDNVRATDTVARYGGEEFAIILPGTPVESARAMTERMRSQLEGMQLAVNASGQQIGRITASFGIAELITGDDTGTLVERADAKLYEAKCAGRNRIAADAAAAAA
jgi:diguanylate cyclase